MKKSIKALFASLFLILSISGSLAAENNKKPEIKTVANYIAIFDFEVRDKDKDISRPLADKVIHEFSQSGKYEVIDRGNMNKILGEQKFQMSGCVAQECKVEAGQILGVGKKVSGSVGIVGKTYYLTLLLIDVKTGKVELSAEDTCKCEVDDLLESTKRLAKKLPGEKVEQPAAAPAPATIAMPKQPEWQLTTGETARDGRFIAYSNGTVLDTKTNLIWAAKDNGSDINWPDAKSYCENYRGGGYSDWRMPTQDELDGLYDVTKTSKSGLGLDFNLTELICLSGAFLWASEKGFTSGAAVFSFVGGIRYRASPVLTLFFTGCFRCVLANRLFDHYTENALVRQPAIAQLSDLSLKLMNSKKIENLRYNRNWFGRHPY